MLVLYKNVYVPRKLRHKINNILSTGNLSYLLLFSWFYFIFFKKINWNRILSLPFLFLTQFPHLRFPSNLFHDLNSQIDSLIFIDYYTHIFMNAYIHVYAQIYIQKTFWVCVFLIICKWFRADQTAIGHSMRGLWQRLILLSTVMVCLYILSKGGVPWDFSLSILICPLILTLLWSCLYSYL